MCVGGGGGGDGGAEEMRRQEEERQQRIREGTNAINQIFGGKVYAKKPNPALAPTSRPAVQYIDQFGMARYRAPRQGEAATATETVRPVNFLGRAPQTVWEPANDVPGQFGDDFFTGLERNYLDYYLPQLTRQAEDADRGLRISLGRTGNLGSSYGARELARLAEDKESNRRRIIDESIKYGSDQRKNLEDTRGNLIGQLEAGAGIENVAGQAAAQARAMTAPPAFSPLGDLFKNYTAAVANASLASGDPRFPGAEEQRRALLFNIPSAGGKNKSAGLVTS